MPCQTNMDIYMYTKVLCRIFIFLMLLSVALASEECTRIDNSSCKSLAFFFENHVAVGASNFYIVTDGRSRVLTQS